MILLEALRLSHRRQTILPLTAWGNILINRQPWSQNRSPLLRYCNWTALNMWSHLNRKSSNIYSIIKPVTSFISVKVTANESLKCICNYFSTKQNTTVVLFYCLRRNHLNLTDEFVLSCNVTVLTGVSGQYIIFLTEFNQIGNAYRAMYTSLSSNQKYEPFVIL